MVWGNPAKDELGTLAKFAECLLDIPVDDEVVSVIFHGPSSRGGVNEGEYTRLFLLGALDKLGEFPRLKPKLNRLSDTERKVFEQRAEALVVGRRIQNTFTEMEEAAAFFGKHKATKVIEIAVPTHAARCMRNQAAARYHGLIDKYQQWFLTASDVNYTGYMPDDVIIAEPIHRRDNPLYGFHPSWAEVTKPYPYLTLENKKKVLRKIDTAMREALADQPDSTEVVN